MMPPPTWYSSARENSPRSMIAGLGGGAAHVEGDDVRHAARPRQRMGADHAAGRAGLDDVHGLGGGRRGAHQAAVRLHDQERRADAPRREVGLEAREIARDDRHHIGVDHGARGALVLLDLGQHLGAQRERQIGRQAPDDCLISRSCAGLAKQLSRQTAIACDALVEQLPDRALGIGRIERADDLAVGRRPARRPRRADDARPAAAAWSRRGRRAAACAGCGSRGRRESPWW